MKRLLSTLATIAILAVPGAAFANLANWTLQLSSPFAATAGKANTRNFNLSVSTSSVNASEVISVSVFQDTALLGTFSESDSSFGGSWSQAVSVPADGSYTFTAVASNNNGDPTKTVETTVNVDTSSPSAPTYLGKTRAGNNYEVRFTAPTTGDVVEVRLFSATTTSFTANSSNQVGSVAVAPGQTTSFTYNAPDAGTRYFAVQAFDAHGNGSTLSGDSVVVPGSAASTTSSSNANSNSTTSQQSNLSVGSSSTQPAGLVEASQENKANKKDAADSVASADKKNKTSWATVAITLAALAALYAGYQWFMQKADKE